MIVTALIVAAQVKAYSPPKVDLPGAMLTSEQHDARYKALGKGLYVLHWKAKSGELMYVGSEHSNDPRDQQFATIEKLWEAFKPDIAFFEGRGSGTFSSRDNAVRQTGEPGLVRFLAKRDGKELLSFEPTVEDETAPLARRFDKRDLVVKMVLTGYFSDRRARPVPDWQVEMGLKRRQTQAGLGKVFENLADMDKYWKEKYVGLGDWRTASETVVWPGKEHTVLNAIANLSNQVRDEHMMRTVVDLMGKGRRVFVVVGRSHVLNQEPVLRAALAPKELESTTKRPWSG